MPKQPELRRWSKLAALALAAAMVLVLFVVVSRAQNTPSDTAAKPGANSGDLVYQCPMDHDVRSDKPGVCSRCGMKLVAGIPEPQEFPVNLSVTPRLLRPGASAQLLFSIRDPDNDCPTEHFEVVHEKLFHMFVISQDMEFFLHDHPYFGADGKFRYDIKFPSTGMYRILSDFYPEGATPQLIARTVIVPGLAQAPALLSRDYATKATGNLSVSLVTDPPQPIAGTKTMLFFRLDPADGIEKLLGAWAHMLAASDDFIDLIHTHPFIADGGPEMQFNIYFPRAQTYRICVQFQRQGLINTARFDVPVKDLE